MAGWRSEYEEAWERTVGLYQLLRSGGQPESSTLDGLGADEQCYADLDFEGERWYGPQVILRYRETPPPLTLNPLRWLRHSVENAVDRAAFERAEGKLAAGEHRRWHSAGVVRVLLTDERLLYETNGGWLSFYHQDVSGLTIDVAECSVVLEYATTAPLRLTGLDAPGYGLLIVWLTGGPLALAEPEFAEFDQG